MIGMGTNMVMAANYFGTFDREGFAAIAASSIDRRCVLVSANLAVLLYVLAQNLILLVVIAAWTRSWNVVPLGVFLGVCLQVGALPACGLAAILVPYRTQLKFTTGRRRGNIWGFLTWLISAPPVLAMIVLPFVFWRSGLILTLPLCGVYCGVLYVLTLRPLARLLQRRESDILAAVSERS
jgi:hypothetical protein